jgi:hypothetical protein
VTTDGESLKLVPKKLKEQSEKRSTTSSSTDKGEIKGFVLYCFELLSFFCELSSFICSFFVACFPSSELQSSADSNLLVLTEEDATWADNRFVSFFRPFCSFYPAFTSSPCSPSLFSFSHLHFGDVLVNVSKKFKSFTAGSAVVSLKTGKTTDVKDMVKAMKEMPSYKAMLKVVWFSFLLRSHLSLPSCLFPSLSGISLFFCCFLVFWS